MRLDTTMACFQRWRAASGRPTHTLDAEPLDHVEEQHIRDVVSRLRPEARWGDIADVLGISQKTLWQKRKQYNIHPPD